MKSSALLRSACALGALSLVLSGCTSLTEPDGQKFTSSPSSEQSTEDPSVLRIPGLTWATGEDEIEYSIHRLTLDQAKPAVLGRDYAEVSSTRELAEAGDLLVPLALDEAGTLTGFIGSQNDHGPDDMVFAGAQRVGTYTDDTFTVFKDAETNKPFIPPKVVVGRGTAGHEGTLWSEGAADSQSSEWKIRWVPAGQTEVRVLARSSDVPIPLDQPVVSYGEPAPVFSQGRVYWYSSFAADDSNVVVPKLLSVAVDDPGNVRIEDVEGFAPASFGSELLYVGTRRPPVDSDHTAAAVPIPATITRLRPDGDATNIVKLSGDAPKGNEIMNLTAQEGAFSFTYLGDFYIVNAQTGKVVALPMPAGTSVTDVVQCDARVSFRFSDGTTQSPDKRFVYDISTGSLLLVQDLGLRGNAQCAGDLMSWSVGEQVEGQFLQWDVVTRWKR